MRKILIILCLGIVSLPVSPLYAHAPEEVVLSYDQGTRSLTVEVVHPVADPASHFVDRIEVLVNGKAMAAKEPPRQDATMLSEVYPLADVKPQDVVKVIAFCNRGGERSGEIHIK